MSPSGAEPELRLVLDGGHETLVRRSQLELRLTDAEPYLDFHLSDESTPRILEQTGAIVHSPDRRGWWRWYVIARPREIARRRRFGWCTLRFQVPDLHLRVALEPARLLSPAEYHRMLDELNQCFPGSIWDDTDDLNAPVGSVDGDFVLGKDDIHSLAALRRHFDTEADIAKRALTSTRPEIVPWRPELGPRTHDARAKSFATPQLQIVRRWASARHRDLSRASNSLQAALDDLDREVRSMRSSNLPKGWKQDRQRTKDQLKTRFESVRHMLARINMIRRALDDFGVPMNRHHAPISRLAGRTGVLMQGLAKPSASVLAGREASLHVQPFPNLFELWGAVELAHHIGSLPDVVPVHDPVVNGSRSPGELITRPRRVRWHFRRGDWEIVFDYGLSATPIDERDGLHPRLLLSRFEQASLRVAEDNLLGYFTVSGCNAPDYLIRVESQGQVAFCFGDAKAADHERNDAGKSLTGQLAAMEKKYARKLGYRSINGVICGCAPAASFVLVPGDGTRWASVVRNNDVQVVEAMPGENATAATQHAVLRILETLTWHAKGGRVEALAAR